MQTSVVSFGVRPGNPKDIQDWDDLIRDDVEVVTPNPFTSGGARWNIMAAFGQAGGAEDEQAGLDYVEQMLANTVVQDASARDSLNTFLQRPGRRHHLVRERGHRRAAGGRGARPGHPGRHDPDRHDRRDRPRIRTRPHGVRRLPLLRGGPDAVRRERLPPGRRGRVRGVRGRVPRAGRTCSRSRSSAAGRRSQRTSSIRRRARSLTFSANWARPRSSSCPRPPHTPRRPRSGSHGSTSGAKASPEASSRATCP